MFSFFRKIMRRMPGRESRQEADGSTTLEQVANSVGAKPTAERGKPSNAIGMGSVDKNPNVVSGDVGGATPAGEGRNVDSANSRNKAA